MRIRNRWTFRKYRWTEERQKEWEIFIEKQIKFFPEIYYGIERAAQLRKQVLSRMTSDERGLFTDYDSNGYRKYVS